MVYFYHFDANVLTVMIEINLKILAVIFIMDGKEYRDPKRPVLFNGSLEVD